MAYINHNVPTMSMPSGMNRMDQFPLDMSSVYYTYAEMENYAKSSAISYVGQILSLVNYAEDGTTVTGVTVYSIQNEAGDLQKVGSVDADNISLKKNADGLLEMAGFKGAANATLPQKKVAEDGTVTLEWVSIDAIVEGDGNTTYTVAAVKRDEEVIGFTFTPSEGEAVTVTLDVYTKSEVDDLIGNYSTPETSEGAGDAVAATGLRAEIELKANAADVYTKTETDTKISEEIGKKIHMTTKVVEELPAPEAAEANVIYLVADNNSEAGTYIEYVLVEVDGVKSLEAIGSTVTDLSDYYTKTEIDTKTTAIEGRIKTLEDIDNATQAELDAYKEEVTTALSKKIETGSIAHTSEGVTEGVTADGTELKIVVDAYTKSEVYTKSEADTKIDEKIASVTGGESAADVKLALESYRDALNKEVWGDSAGSWTTSIEEDGKTVVKYEPAYGATSRIDTLTTAVGTAQQTADKGVSDAAGALGRANAAHTLATANGTEIATLRDTTVPAVKATADKNKEDIAALQTIVSGHTGSISGLEAAVARKAETQTVTDLATRVGTNEGAIAQNKADVAALTEVVNGKVNASAVYTKGEVDGLVSGEAKARTQAINGINAKIGTIAEGKDVATLIGENATAISNVNKAIADEVTRATAAEKANADAIKVLNGTATDDGSVRKMANEQIAAALAGADTDFDTLKEMSDWLAEHKGSAAEMNSAIAANDTAIKANATAIKANTDALAILNGTDDGSIAKMIADAAPAIATTEVAGIVKASTGHNAVQVAEDGTMSVASVKVSTLFQDVTLVFDGGNASGEVNE